MPEVSAPADRFGDKLRSVLQRGLHERSIEARVSTEHVRRTTLHRAMVVSPQFEDMSHLERQEVVWQVIRSKLSPDEQLRISIVMALTPEEIGEPQ